MRNLLYLRLAIILYVLGFIQGYAYLTQICVNCGHIRRNSTEVIYSRLHATFAFQIFDQLVSLYHLHRPKMSGRRRGSQIAELLIACA